MEFKDSGERQQFEGGAQRDSATGKPQYHFFSPYLWPMLHPIWGRHIRSFLLTKDVRFLYDCERAMREDVGLARLAEWLRLGALKYSEFNWAKGMTFTRVVDSLGRHFEKAWAGETDEDHGAAAYCNLMFLMHYVREIQEGRLDPKWDDLFNFNLYHPEVPSIVGPS